MIFGFLKIFRKWQASSTFEALTYASLSTCQSDVRPLVQTRWRPTSFCRVSTGIQTSFHLVIWKMSVHLSLCRKPGLHSSQGISGSISLEAEITGSFSINIPEGKLLLRCFWNVGLPLQSKIGNQLSSPDDMWCMELSSSCFTEIDLPLDLRWVSQWISGFF